MKYSNLKINYSYLGLAFVSFLLLQSCFGEKTELIELDTIILVSDKIGTSGKEKIPKTFIEVALPLEKCDKANFRLIPTLIRMDEKESKRSLAFDLKSRSGNTENPRLAKRFIEEELQTYDIGDAFAAENPPLRDLKSQMDTFLSSKSKKAKVFYFSKDGESSEQYNGQEVIFTLEELLTAINQSLCEDIPSQIIVVFNPPPTETIPPNPPSVETDIEMIFNKIGDVDVSPDIRMELIDNYIEYFTENAEVKEFGEEGTIVELTPIRTYLEKIALYKTTDHIEIKETLKNENGKYWEIRVIEHH